MDKQEYDEKLMHAATGGLRFRENHGEGHYGLIFPEDDAGAADGEQEQEDDGTDRG